MISYLPTNHPAFCLIIKQKQHCLSHQKNAKSLFCAYRLCTMPIHFEWTPHFHKQKKPKSSKFDTFLKQRFICRLVGIYVKGPFIPPLTYKCAQRLVPPPDCSVCPPPPHPQPCQVTPRPPSLPCATSHWTGFSRRTWPPRPHPWPATLPPLAQIPPSLLW